MMKMLAGFVSFLFFSGCARIPVTAVEISQTPSAAPSAVAMTATLAATELLETIPPAPTPFLQLPEEDQVLFTIPNPEHWSGKEGDSRPDWKGWGAAAFDVAPDGSFWIADTAVFPNRLLHYSPGGELLREISLEGLVVHVYDLAVSAENIWLLDISSQPAKSGSTRSGGEYLASLDAPHEVFSLNLARGMKCCCMD